VRVFELSVTVPPLGTPETEVTVGVPDVPGGTLMVTELSDELLPVEKVYV
jgi:hypothetical protein